jgi:hypothetical protein
MNIYEKVEQKLSVNIASNDMTNLPELTELADLHTCKSYIALIHIIKLLDDLFISLINKGCNDNDYITKNREVVKNYIDKIFKNELEYKKQGHYYFDSQSTIDELKKNKKTFETYCSKKHNQIDKLLSKRKNNY